ncbi:hypothetical protein TREPR_1525 [Treponema primitia ZAS-2]|uniref:Uncharacterized protein n=1 Tax=Treponema primitia (strain ATCC BAA-887 / DSM 12427 / ZAS-2) TaxID=545694 RepID=F5YPH4_TREPZ|nr:hypothetical protein TREPR_1525 [Treponema primitia ZAS-2]
MQVKFGKIHVLNLYRFFVKMGRGFIYSSSLVMYEGIG